MVSSNKTILITGATGNIGITLCNHLAAQRNRLIIAAKTKTKLEQLAASISRSYPGASVVYAAIDYNEPASYADLYALCKDGVDGVVLMPPKIKPTHDCFPANSAWQHTFNECFIGPVDLLHGLMPFLKMKQQAKVVFISGISSVQVLSHYATSNVIRAAWLAQAKTLAFAYGPEGIHFNTLSLGGVMTDEFISKLEQETVEKQLSYQEILAERVSNIPLRKYASTQEVAEAVAGLLSNFANHITGLNVLCDGGFTRSY